MTDTKPPLFGAESPATQRLPRWRYVVGIIGVLAAVGVVTRCCSHGAHGDLLILAFFFSIIWGCLLMVPATGANTVAHHGAGGLIIGFVIGVCDVKVGLVLGLVGAFVGGGLGLLVGRIRVALVAPVSQPSESIVDAKDASVADTDVRNNGSLQSPPAADQPPADG